MSASRKFLPLLVFVFFASLTVALWRVQVDHLRQLVVLHVESSAQLAADRIGAIMESRQATLEMLADRWVRDEGHDFGRPRFLSFASIIFKDYPGFCAIFWADPKGVIRYAYPPGTQANHRPKPVRYLPGHRVSPCFDLLPGEKGFRVVLPLLYEGRLQGYLCAEFKVADLVALAMPAKFINYFVVDLYDQDRPIFHYGKAHQYAKGICSTFQIPVGERKWRLTMAPGRAAFAAGSPHAPWLLAFGLILSAALCLLLYQLLLKMEAYRTSRDLALGEVAERIRVEAVLHQKEKELQELVLELSTKNSELESFVYTISHDLKTPIVTIGGFIGALREDFGPSIPREAEGYLDYMSKAGVKMEKLIDDLLEFSRIGRLDDEKVLVSFGEIVREALETLAPNIKSRSIRINVEQNLPEIYCEKNRLVQLVYNLINNAVKYIGENNPDPRIDIGAQNRDDRWVFYVRDNGIGIEEKYFEKIFHIFERLPSAQNQEGTGVGLAIVKRIVDYHGGRVWVGSQPGSGTTFFFTIAEKKRNQELSS
ncbi:MAG: ATP-binding protein [Syntrophobacteraceae bacterium]